MKKKCFVLISVGILLLASFAGCSQTDPKELYQGAVDKMNELDEVDMEMNMNMSMSVLGETMNFVMDSHIQTVAEEFLMESNVEIPGQGSVATNVYYTGGYLYLDTQGQQIKVAASLMMRCPCWIQRIFPSERILRLCRISRRRRKMALPRCILR